MKNVEMTVAGNILTIKVDLSKEFGPSASGKTTIIASTLYFQSYTGIRWSMKSTNAVSLRLT